MTTPAKLTPKQLAERLETDPKTVRRFLRATIPAKDHPPKGRSWRLDSKLDWESRYEQWFRTRANRSEIIRRETHSTRDMTVIVSSGGFRTS